MWVVVSLLSISVFVASILVLRLIVVRLPATYFSASGIRRRGSAGLVVRVGKNLLGIVLLGAGIVMLFTPGQGILTILIGLSLVDFPGKFRLERWLISRPRVLPTINGWRARAGRPALVLDD